MLPLRNIGYFLTGDGELQYRWDDIKQHFDREFPRMSGVMFPHHGSNKNDADKLIPEVKRHSIFYFSADIGTSTGIHIRR